MENNYKPISEMLIRNNEIEHTILLARNYSLSMAVKSNRNEADNRMGKLCAYWRPAFTFM